MRLSDIIGGMGLSAFPQIALVLFLVVFVAMIVRVLSRGRKAEYARAATLPLEDDTVMPVKGGSSHGRA